MLSAVSLLWLPESSTKNKIGTGSDDGTKKESGAIKWRMTGAEPRLRQLLIRMNSGRRYCRRPHD